MTNKSKVSLQNAENRILGLWNFKIFWGSTSPDPPPPKKRGITASWYSWLLYLNLLVTSIFTETPVNWSRIYQSTNNVLEIRARIRNVVKNTFPMTIPTVPLNSRRPWRQHHIPAISAIVQRHARNRFSRKWGSRMRERGWGIEDGGSRMGDRGWNPWIIACCNNQTRNRKQRETSALFSQEVQYTVYVVH